MNYNINCTCDFAQHLRKFSPIPGTDYRKLIMVALEKGERIGEHQHKGGTVLYYPFDSSTIEFEPYAGTIIYLPPGVRHTVPPVPADRVSFALVVDP